MGKSSLVRVLKITDLKPKNFPADMYKASDLLIGVIAGKATGARIKDDNDPVTGEKKGEYSELTGTFKMIARQSYKDEDVLDLTKLKSYDALVSGVLRLPETFHNVIAGMVNSIPEGPEGKGVEVPFLYAAYLYAAPNPNGYSWKLEDLSPPRQEDTLDSVFAQLPSTITETPAITDETSAEQPVETATAAKPKGKATA